MLLFKLNISLIACFLVFIFKRYNNECRLLKTLFSFLTEHFKKKIAYSYLILMLKHLLKFMNHSNHKSNQEHFVEISNVKITFRNTKHLDALSKIYHCLELTMNTF